MSWAQVKRFFFWILQEFRDIECKGVVFKPATTKNCDWKVVRFYINQQTTRWADFGGSHQAENRGLLDLSNPKYSEFSRQFVKATKKDFCFGSTSKWETIRRDDSGLNPGCSMQEWTADLNWVHSGRTSLSFLRISWIQQTQPPKSWKIRRKPSQALGERSLK